MQCKNEKYLRHFARLKARLGYLNLSLQCWMGGWLTVRGFSIPFLSLSVSWSQSPTALIPLHLTASSVLAS